MEEMVRLERIEQNHLDKVEDFPTGWDVASLFFLNSLSFNQFSVY